LINNRVLVDNNGNQKGTFVLRGTIVKSLPSGDALMSFEGSNNIFNKGVINTQGAVKLSDLAAGVTFAIVGGTAGSRRLAEQSQSKLRSSRTRCDGRPRPSSHSPFARG
jgi:hypothetical protein